MSEASVRPHSRICEAIKEFNYYQKWISNSKNIVTSAEDYIISCPKLGYRLREVGERVLAECTDDFLHLCRRVLVDHMSLSELDDSDNDSMTDGAWPDRRMFTSSARFNAQLNELRQNMCEYDLYGHTCGGCIDECNCEYQRRKQSRKCARAQFEPVRTLSWVHRASVLTLTRARCVPVLTLTRVHT